MSNEADTCRRLVTPRLLAAGWDTAPCSLDEQRQVTDGRIVPRGEGCELTLTQEGVPSDVTERTEHGWTTILDGLGRAIR